MTADINVGDRVRVEFEGDVWCVNDDGSLEVIYKRGMPSVDYVPACLAEKIAAPLKVGDIVEDEAYAALPFGAVVTDEAGDVFLRTPDGWVDGDGNQWDAADLESPRTIRYLPPSK